MLQNATSQNNSANYLTKETTQRNRGNYDLPVWYKLFSHAVQFILSEQNLTSMA